MTQRRLGSAARPFSPALRRFGRELRGIKMDPRHNLVLDFVLALCTPPPPPIFASAKFVFLLRGKPHGGTLRSSPPVRHRHVRQCVAQSCTKRNYVCCHSRRRTRAQVGRTRTTHGMLQGFASLSKQTTVGRPERDRICRGTVVNWCLFPSSLHRSPPLRVARVRRTFPPVINGCVRVSSKSSERDVAPQREQLCRCCNMWLSVLQRLLSCSCRARKRLPASRRLLRRGGRLL